MILNEFEITGRERSHVIQQTSPRYAAIPEVCENFRMMREAAAFEGIDLRPFSSFRDFKTQLRIWNDKYTGKKPLYDIDGKVRNFADLNPEEIVQHILDWSALPGGSRHQWGTEIDVIDGNAMPAGYVPKLLPEEVGQDGIFYKLHQWLDKNISRFGFFRPYREFRGGMFPEPWHLSYYPISSKVIRELRPELLAQVLAETEIYGKDILLPRIPEIFRKHILNICEPDSTAYP
jgi:LAS superfamily LD-carboxypeptidase LdcB